jgi:hypothetical protein
VGQGFDATPFDHTSLLAYLTEKWGLDMPGVTPAQVGSFYEAAAGFFRQAPWKKVGDEAAIQVGCAKFPSGPWYAVVMGQSGLTTGLALYDDLKGVGTAAGLGTGTRGGVPASGARLRGVAQAGRPGQGGRRDGAGGVGAVQPRTVVGGRRVRVSARAGAGGLSGAG